MEILKNYIDNLGKAQAISSRMNKESGWDGGYNGEPEIYSYEDESESLYKFENGVILSYINYSDDTPGFVERYQLWQIKDKAGLDFDYAYACLEKGEWDMRL